MSSRDLEFLYEISSLRHLTREWLQHLATDCANDLEHSFRVVFLALAIARREKMGSEEKIMKMALLHDIAETRTSDLSHVQKMYVTVDEPRALRDMFAGTVFPDFENLALEYKKRDTIEAQIVKDADNLDVDMELRELEEKGHKLPGKWRELRQLVRNEKLYTAAAKSLWDEIQISDPASWHLAVGKWLELPNSGK
jgi:putative hydrolase of HD superfamily